MIFTRETVMSFYEIEIQHDDQTFEALSHMQYDLFCKGNKVGRVILSFAFILLGVSNFDVWWGVLVAAYGCYLSTSTYSAANHTAHKLAKQIRDSGMPFPSSRYIFEEKFMRVIPLGEDKGTESQFEYLKAARLGEDLKYFYIFRDSYGGYMIPKEALGDEMWEFRQFIEDVTKQRFEFKTAPVVRLISRMAGRKRVQNK